MIKLDELTNNVLSVFFQVGTGTGIMTHYFNLFVIVPTAVISGNDEYHIGEGSSLTLYCEIENVSSITNSFNVLLFYTNKLYYNQYDVN